MPLMVLIFRENKEFFHEFSLQKWGIQEVENFFSNDVIKSRGRKSRGIKMREKNKVRNKFHETVW